MGKCIDGNKKKQVNYRFSPRVISILQQASQMTGKTQTYFLEGFVLNDLAKLVRRQATLPTIQEVDNNNG